MSLVYQRHQKTLLNSLKDKDGLVVAGDGRTDSPGHSAKYGTYSVIELGKTRSTLAGSAPAKSMAADVRRFPAGTSLING